MTLSYALTRWRHVVLLATICGSLAAIMLFLEDVQEICNGDYHDFADQRTFFGIRNFFNVISNVPFAIVGLIGFSVANQFMVVGYAWLAFFTGVAFVSIGSIYYHLDPSNATLVWDRLPMTIGFMGLFVALLGEYVSPRLSRSLLVPALLTGVFSVFYWHCSGDLRLYAWIQLLPLLAIPTVMVLYKPRYSHQSLLLVALGWYATAKSLECYDKEVFAFTQDNVSGHTLKHLFAAVACLSVLRMLRKRRLISDDKALQL